jgi:hypothetical protein
LVRQRVQPIDAGFSRQFCPHLRQAQAVAPDGASGVESTYWFCSDCGGRAYGQRDARPDIIAVRAGTLDDTSWLRPVAHVFMRSAQAWERIPNNAECFEIMPKDFWTLAEKWQELWKEDW